MKLLKIFEEKRPEIVFEWKDKETSAEGWVVINSLRGGASGGGTRMQKGLSRVDVESLAKIMEIKFTISGPPIGGAKSGINFDPNDPRKAGVLKRWYKAVIPLLKNYYGTGGDMYVDEVSEVIPYTEECGLWHPQEGIVHGYFHSSDSQKIKKIGQLRYGVSKIIEDANYTPSLEKKYTVADMITGYGVAKSVIHFYSIWGGDISSKRAIIQGWGNVGAAAGFYLAKQGVKIVGIIDKSGGVINTEGFTFEQIIQLILNRDGVVIKSKNILPFDQVNEKIWHIGAEIFIPAAASRLVKKKHVKTLINNGIELISSGANLPFEDSEILFGSTLSFADTSTAVIPDFIANCGMARVFAYLMGEAVEITDKSIFDDTSSIIESALRQIYNIDNTTTKITERSLNLAISQLI